MGRPFLNRKSKQTALILERRYEVLQTGHHQSLWWSSLTVSISSLFPRLDDWLANPCSDYFPFHQVGAKLPVAPHFSQDELAETSQSFSAGKYDTVTGESSYDLQIALNYGQSMGPGAVLRFVTEHTEAVHNPLIQTGISV